MPGLTAAEWVLVGGNARLARLAPAHGVLTQLSVISGVLRANALLNDDNVADVARRMNLDIGELQGWAVVGDVVDRNNRYEVDIRRSFRMAAGNHPGYVTKVVNCSKRHNKEDYWIAYDDPVPAGANLNSVAYCSTDNFKRGLLAFAAAIAERCNVWEGRRRLHPADPPPRADALVNYVVPAGQPKFESDSGAGNSIHAYCVATAGVAVTLSAAIHADFKEVLRGVYAPAGSLARRNAAAAWARVGGDAGVQEITTVHERTAFDRQLG